MLMVEGIQFSMKMYQVSSMKIRDPKILAIDIRYAWIAKNLITSGGNARVP